jgi:hypothetical protein
MLRAPVPGETAAMYLVDEPEVVADSYHEVAGRSRVLVGTSCSTPAPQREVDR